MSMERLAGGKLYVATAKGKGTGPNNFPQRQVAWQIKRGLKQGVQSYIATLLYGSLAVLDVKAMEQELPKWTDEVHGVEPDEGSGGEDPVCRWRETVASSM